MKKQAAAQYVEIELPQMEKVLKRAARIMRPKKGVYRGMVYYDLKLSELVGIRVWTSIPERRGTGKDVGKSAIRVGLIQLDGGRPLKKGKMPIVKRTQGWADSLRARIRDARVEYKDKAEYWESRAGGMPESPSDAQLGMIRGLVTKMKGLGFQDADFDGVAKTLGLGDNPQEFSKTQASEFIALLTDKSEELEKTKAMAPPEPSKRAPQRRADTATFAKLRSGDWGMKGMGLVEGDSVTVVRKNGAKSVLEVGRIVWTGDDGMVIAEIARSSRRYATDLDDEVPDYDRSVPA